MPAPALISRTPNTAPEGPDMSDHAATPQADPQWYKVAEIGDL
jgi:hypothetical protein